MAKNTPGKQKMALTEEKVNFLRGRLVEQGAWRDLALLEVALSTLLRASDVLKLKVSEVADDKLLVRESLEVVVKKTGRSHSVILGSEARIAIQRVLGEEGKRYDDYLFTRRHRPHGTPLQVQSFIDITKGWAKILGIDPEKLGTHSLRRTAATYFYNRTGSIRMAQELLGHATPMHTQHYLSVSLREALEELAKDQI